MTFNIFNYNITIEKNKVPIRIINFGDIILAEMSYSTAKKYFLRDLRKRYSKNTIHENRIPAIKDFRAMVKARCGVAISLRDAKEYIERYFQYRK